MKSQMLGYRSSIVWFLLIAAMLFHLSCGARVPPPGPGENEPPIYICVMVHMEGVSYSAPAFYARHVDWLRDAMVLFDDAAYQGAKLTIESRREFAIADDAASGGLEFLQEVVTNGHGVGTHCDFAYLGGTDYVDYVNNLIANKTLVDARVGPDENKGVSGIGADIDWAGAAADAGFCYVNGVVGKHYLPMDAAYLPTGWTHAELNDPTNPKGHKTAPVDLRHRIHPFPIENADDFYPDSPGRIVVFGGGLGPLYKAADYDPRTGVVGCGGVPPTATDPCELDMDDIDTAEWKIRQAIAAHAGSPAFAKIEFHLPPSTFTQTISGTFDYDAELRAFLEMVAGYVVSGDLVWATELEAFEAYQRATGWSCP